MFATERMTRRAKGNKFSNHISNQDQYLEYIKNIKLKSKILSKTIKKNKNSIRNWAKDIERYFPKIIYRWQINS